MNACLCRKHSIASLSAGTAQVRCGAGDACCLSLQITVASKPPAASMNCSSESVRARRHQPQPRLRPLQRPLRFLVLDVLDRRLDLLHPRFRGFEILLGLVAIDLFAREEELRDDADLVGGGFCEA